MNSFSLAHLFEVAWWDRWTSWGICGPPSYLVTIAPSISLCHLQSSNTHTTLFMPHRIGGADVFLHAAYFLYMAELLA